jgi:hypothetical protein
MNFMLMRPVSKNLATAPLSADGHTELRGEIIA